jgi:ATPase subunit of ABC transporter with duplicated ATPase domains
VDGGKVIISQGAAVGYLEQTAVSGSSRSVAEEARSRMAATAAAARLAAAEAAAGVAGTSASAVFELAAARDAYEAAGGAGAERRLASVLEGLGFSRAQREQRCDALSGGWQMRVALARLLLSPAGEGRGPSLLLLDEPSNHLDAAAAAFLADYLRRSGAATLLVSHDGALLDGACDRLAEVRGGALHGYSGGYARFATERARRAEAAASKNAKLDAEAAKLEDFVRRFGAKATKATAAKSKQKALDKLNAAREADPELAAAASIGAAAGPGDATKVALMLPPPPPGAAEAVILDRAAFGIDPDAAPTLRDVSLVLQRKMRLIVLGPNGAGKSTLLAALAGRLPLRGGSRREGDGLSLGMFTQDLAQALPADAIAAQHVLAAARIAEPLLPDERARAALGALGLRGDAALRRIGDLSGGEKARVALAAFVLTPANVLLLDEPTNHCDATALEALTDALQEWPGALAVVTHNRAFAEALAPTHALTVAAGRARLHQCVGGVIEEHHWGAEIAADAAAAAAAAAAPAAAAAAAPAAAAFEARKRAQRSAARLEKLMVLIEAAEVKAAACDTVAAAAFEKGDSEAGNKAVAQRAKLDADVAAHFEEAEALEAALAADSAATDW